MSRLLANKSNEIYYLVWLVAIILVSVIIFLAIFLPIKIITNGYKKFVLENSVALKNLEEINKRYKFKKIPDFSMSHS